MEEFPSDESLKISDEELRSLDDSNNDATENLMTNKDPKEDLKQEPLITMNSDNEDYDIVFRNKIDSIIDLIVGDDGDIRTKIQGSRADEKSVSFILSELNDIKKNVDDLRNQKLSIQGNSSLADDVLKEEIQSLKQENEGLRKEFEEFKSTAVGHLIKHYRLLDVMTRKMNER